MSVGSEQDLHFRRKSEILVVLKTWMSSKTESQLKPELHSFPGENLINLDKPSNSEIES